MAEAIYKVVEVVGTSEESSARRSTAPSPKPGRRCVNLAGGRSSRFAAASRAIR